MPLTVTCITTLYLFCIWKGCATIKLLCTNLIPEVNNFYLIIPTYIHITLQVKQFF